MVFYIFVLIYNPGCSRILIGSFLCSIEGQRHDQYIIITEFFPLRLKMAESFEKLDNISRSWAKVNYKKGLLRHLNRFEKQEEERQSHFL